MLAMEQVAEPALKPGHVLVGVRAAGVNFADVHFRKGTYFVKPVFPQIPGLEAAGEVLAIGDGVTGLSAGQRVVTFAAAEAYAERLVTPAGYVFPIPDALTFEDAVTIAVQGVTAMHVLTLAGRMKAGERVLVHAAAGGVGSIAVQLAKLLGAGLVIGTASSEEKCALVRELGADVVCDYRTGDYVQVVKSASRDGVDVVLEMLGGTEIYKRNLACLAPFGRMVVYGAASGEIRGTLEPVSLMGKNASVIGYYLTTIMRQPGPAAGAVGSACAPAIARLAELVIEKKLRLLRAATLPLERAAEAHRLLEDRKTIGKVILTV